MRKLAVPALLVLAAACGEAVTEPSSDPVAVPSSNAVVEDDAEFVDCSLQNNNSVKKLTECVTLDAVRAHQAALQAIADANGGIRASGTPGYNASVDYISGLLRDAGYDVTLQPFQFVTSVRQGPSTLAQLAPGTATYVEFTDFSVMSQSAAGDVTAPVTAVDLQLGLGNASTSGCEPADFLGFTPGHIALIQRGACTFQLKAENAAAAGAVGAIIFNQGNSVDRVGLINGTLGTDYAGGIPVMEVTYDLGAGWAATTGLVMRLMANVFSGEVTTYNVLAETPDGDASNVVMAGGHLDSVDRGPGINDNGSGSAVLLEVALQMALVKPRNKVRFAWWGAEESGLIGSDYYVENLSDSERQAIALYLNFDMIGSPNFGYFVYDGDGSDFGLQGPQGSAAIEEFFEGFYAERGLGFEGAQISFRSDYAAFFDYGIPFGGLFTGAEGVKTAAQAALWGGVAGASFDPCYHQACDTFDNVSLEALDVNADAVAAAVIQYAMSTEMVNGRKGKGNFGPKDGKKGAVQPTSEAVIR